MRNVHSKIPLVSLGLTELESEIYMFLVENSPATGYRIAAGINKPAANTYQALRSMLGKGIVILEDSTPRAYRAVPTELLLERMEKRFSKMKSQAAAELAKLKPAAEDEKVYRLQTVEQVYERFREMLKASQQIVLLDLFPAALAELKTDAEATAGRGVHVLIKAYQPAEVRGCVVVVEPEGRRILGKWPGIGANGIADGREHIIAFLSTDGSAVHDALWSRNKLVSSNYHSALFSDLLLGALLEGLPCRPDQFPERYVKLRRLKAQEIPGYAILLKRFRGEPPRKKRPR